MAGIYVDGSEVKEVWVDGVKCKEVWVDGVKVFPSIVSGRIVATDGASTPNSVYVKVEQLDTNYKYRITFSNGYWGTKDIPIGSTSYIVYDEHATGGTMPTNYSVTLSYYNGSRWIALDNNVIPNNITEVKAAGQKYVGYKYGLGTIIKPQGNVNNTGSGVEISFAGLKPNSDYLLVDYWTYGTIDILTNSHGAYDNNLLIGSFNGFDTGNPWSLVIGYDEEILSGTVG